MRSEVNDTPRHRTRPKYSVKNTQCYKFALLWGEAHALCLLIEKLPIVVKLRQGSGKDRQGMAVKAKGLKA